jgi:hypothetical protein
VEPVPGAVGEVGALDAVAVAVAVAGVLVAPPGV